MKEQMKKIGSGLKKAGQATVSATKATGWNVWSVLKKAGPEVGDILREAAPNLITVGVVIGTAAIIGNRK